MTVYIPRRLFLTKGAGTHREKRFSFEMAMRDAGIDACNLVRVSSILPPQCTIIPKEKGLAQLKAGEIVHCVMADMAANEYNRLIAASVGIAVPQHADQHGYLSEHHGYGITDEECGDYAEDLAAEMLATILGIDLDPDASYDEKRDIWRMSDRIVRTRNVTHSAVVKKGQWTTVLAAAILLD